MFVWGNVVVSRVALTIGLPYIGSWEQTCVIAFCALSWALILTLILLAILSWLDIRNQNQENNRENLIVDNV